MLDLLHDPDKPLDFEKRIRVVGYSIFRGSGTYFFTMSNLVKESG